MRLPNRLSLIALLLISAPLSAQSFSLPEPTPTPSARPQGPVDDTGVVPVGPRVIPTARPSAQPTATPSPAPSAVPSPTPTPSPTASRTPAPRPSATATPASSATRTPQLVPGPIATPEPSPQPTAELTGAPAITPSLPSVDAVEASEEEQPFVLYAALAALIAALLAAGAWLLVSKRRRSAAAPTIEPPVVAGNSGNGAALATKPIFAPTLEVTSVSRSVMMVTVQVRVAIANRSDRALRDLVIAADLVSVRRGEDQRAGPATQLPEVGTIERIGPHQTGRVDAMLQLPIGSLEVMFQGQVPMFVPLVRVKISGSTIEDRYQTYVVGVGNGMQGARLHPLPLNGPPGSYQGIGARPVDQAEG